MTTDQSVVTIHMVASVDGFIEKKDGSLSWLESTDSYDRGIGYEGADELIASIDCYVMGSRTYELAQKLGWIYGDKPTVVLTSRNLRAERPSVELYSGDLPTLVNDRLKPKYKSIWLVGGAAVVKEFLRMKLADEIRLAIMPIIVGDGTLFFDYIGREQPLHLKDVTAYKNGLVELWYETRKER
jgi:dihydrofolate reductase